MAQSAALIPLLPVVLTVACLTAGCGGESTPPARVVLARYDFPPAAYAEALAARTEVRTVAPWGDDWGRHHFRSGFRAPDEGGVWMRGESAVIDLLLPGRNCELELRATTSPLQVAAGMSLVVEVSGRELGRLPLTRAWHTDTLVVSIPDELLSRGSTPVTLRAVASAMANGIDDAAGCDRDPDLTVYVQGLRVVADLDGSDQECWRGLAGTDADAALWRPAAVGSQHERRPARANAERPDILLLLLDAARPDHFGCYGYHRDTTPFMDTLAAEGIAFRQVFANSSYTTCSSPCLVTGRSWVDHGVVTREDALADSLLTLAEVLHGAGYRTFAYSGSPNFARGSGQAQGFDTFVETWTLPLEGLTAPRVRELPVTELMALEADDLGPEPVFCHVHLIPPHEPYEAGPEHDLWRDPSYAGAMDGSYGQVLQILRGEIVPDAADRERLVSLYDANLHRADALVRRAIMHWRELARDRDLLVVILADHGEAFGEHGDFAHSTTVYDEMIRIPLIVWPADLAGDIATGQDVLLALTDVMPLLLRAVGVPVPRQTTWPERFLAVNADPTARRPGVIVRAEASRHLLGYRERDHLTIFDGWAVQEFYDLAADPGATRDLRRAQPWEYARRVGMLRRVVALSSVDTGEAAPLSERDEKALRALGY